MILKRRHSGAERELKTSEKPMNLGVRDTQKGTEH